MKVVLLQPNIKNMVACLLPSYVSTESGHYPPLGLMYIAAAVEKKLIADISIIDASLEGLSIETLKDEIGKSKPDLVGITATSFTLIDVIASAKAIKEVNAKIHICIGGPHTSTYPVETIKSPFVDSVIIGEGEESFVELVANLSESKGLGGIKGLIFKDKANTIKDNGRREYIKDIDLIPFPARRLVENNKYKSIIGEKYVMTTIESSRGCSFNCIYCYHAFGRSFRPHSVEYMLKEIDDCLALGIKEFWYFDDNFTIDRKRAVSFCNALINRKKDIVWHIRSRIDLIDRELALLLKKAGCKRISIGIESASPTVLKTIRKNIDLDEAKENFRMLRSLGFELYLDFMIGSPGETKEEILQTIDLSCELNPDYVQFAITTPYPATDLYKMGLETGVYKSDIWREFASQPFTGFHPPILNEHLDREELGNLLDLAYKKFYLRFSYILKNAIKVNSFSEFMLKTNALIKVIKNVIFK